MEIIIALLMFNCDLHLDKDSCVDKHVKCVEIVSTLKRSIGGHLMTHEKRLAAAYLYCVETGGSLDSSLGFPKMSDSLEDYDGFHLWQKPDFGMNAEASAIQE